MNTQTFRTSIAFTVIAAGRIPTNHSPPVRYLYVFNKVMRNTSLPGRSNNTSRFEYRTEFMRCAD